MFFMPIKKMVYLKKMYNFPHNHKSGKIRCKIILI